MSNRYRAHVGKGVAAVLLSLASPGLAGTAAAEGRPSPPDARADPIRVLLEPMAAPTYRAFEAPIESPHHAPVPPPADGRTLAVDPADPQASPLGWHDTGTSSYTLHRGNNTHAYDDRDANQMPPPVEPDCGPTLLCDFDFPIDFGLQEPVTYTAAAVTNLFYWTNLFHDVQYRYGFDETAGNFQVNNFGLGGLGDDDIPAEAQDGFATCGGNFLTPPDGSRPLLQVTECGLVSPARDGAFDAFVILHLLGHGISNRLVGGPANVGCLTNQQTPVEGLSDWWGLAHTIEVGDQGTDKRGVGTYMFGQAPDGDGIRPQPYSTDPLLNDYTYESIDGMSVPFDTGSVWAQAYWEVTWALIDRHGFDPDFHNAQGGAGNQRALRYISEGLKNTICFPAFTDLRDGIVQAVLDNFGGQDFCTVWRAFAAFGLGVDAVSGGPHSTSPTNGFEVPPGCAAEIFADGFESGDTSAWSVTVP